MADCTVSIATRVNNAISDNHVSLSELQQIAQQVLMNRTNMSQADTIAVADLIVNQQSKLSWPAKLLLPSVLKLMPQDVVIQTKFAAMLKGDNKITYAEAKQALDEIQRNGLSPVERKALNAVLTGFGQYCTPDAKLELQRALSAPTCGFFDGFDG